MKKKTTETFVKVIQKYIYQKKFRSMLIGKRNLLYLK